LDGQHNCWPTANASAAGTCSGWRGRSTGKQQAATEAVTTWLAEARELRGCIVVAICCAPPADSSSRSPCSTRRAQGIVGSCGRQCIRSVDSSGLVEFIRVGVRWKSARHPYQAAPLRARSVPRAVGHATSTRKTS